MQFYQDENEKFSDSEILVTLSPNFNTTGYLEFQINPTGGHLQLSDTTLSFAVDIPAELVPDNFFVSKLFEHCEVNINHTVINTKSSDNDYPLTTYFMTRMNWDESTLVTNGALEGYWGNRNLDAGSFQLNNNKENENVIIRRENTERITLDGKDYYRYQFITKLGIGIAMTPQPLPKNAPSKLTFYRADASKSLLTTEMDDHYKTKATNPDRTIKLVNPILHASFIQSEHYDRKYANHRIQRVDFPFLDFNIHRELLLNGVDQFQIKLSEGKRNSFSSIL